MRFILFILAVITFIFGIFFFGAAKSAIHEIEGMIVFLISAVFFTGSCICSYAAEIRKEIKLQTNNEPETVTPSNPFST
jgi:hypothetical protein